MNSDQVIITLLDSLVTILRQEHEKYKKVIDLLNKAGYELASISRNTASPQDTASQKSNQIDGDIKKLMDNFQDPSQNPIMDQIQKSEKIIQDNKKFQKEYLDAMDQIKQEEIIDNLKTSSPQP